MKDNIRNMYPGGNTPKGFYSYYSFILPQNKAKKIICLKGGPGVGKSTLMKKIGKHFEKKNESIEYMWCSSDPGSLDGVLLKERGAAVIDGTSPHVTDPVNPAVIDEILDLGVFWNQNSIMQHKHEIIELNKQIGIYFKTAYGYLAVAGQQYDFLWDTIKLLAEENEVLTAKRRLDVLLNSLTPVKRAENKCRRDFALGKPSKKGEERKAFAGAVTPLGIRSALESLCMPLQNIIVLQVPVGFKSRMLLEPVVQRFREAGYDVEKYYCPMDPQYGIQHVIIPEIKTGIFTSNGYHKISSFSQTGKISRIVYETPEGNELFEEVTPQLTEGIDNNINLAVKYLFEAKKCHDRLEEYYSPNMDYNKLDQIAEETIEKLDGMIL